MSCCDLTLTVHEEEPITLEIVEATIKPEQDKTVTPTYSEQTVLPDAGMTLGSVTVEPIPEPTDRMTITENGSYDVARIGGVDVEVPQGVFPEGTLDIAENGTYDVAQYAAASVDVATVPKPIVLQRINLADEQPHSVTIDPTVYDLADKTVVYIELDQVTSSASDWIYLRSGRVSMYLRDARLFTNFATLAMFVKLGGDWHLSFNDGTDHARFPPNGMIAQFGTFSIYEYNASTIFLSGEIRLMAI